MTKVFLYYLKIVLWKFLNFVSPLTDSNSIFFAAVGYFDFDISTYLSALILIFSFALKIKFPGFKMCLFSNCPQMSRFRVWCQKNARAWIEMGNYRDALHLWDKQIGFEILPLEVPDRKVKQQFMQWFGTSWVQNGKIINNNFFYLIP